MEVSQRELSLFGLEVGAKLHGSLSVNLKSNTQLAVTCLSLEQ